VKSGKPNQQLNQRAKAPAAPVWVEGLIADLTVLRQEIEARGFSPDLPARWSWDPWPDRSNARHYIDRAAGTGTPSPFLDPEKPARFLEAHVWWNAHGFEQWLLVLPGQAQGKLNWQWHPLVTEERTVK